MFCPDIAADAAGAGRWRRCMENNENIESIGQSEETAAEKRKDILCELVADKQYVQIGRASCRERV